ncbi:head-tail adaptor protein [Falsirhodobacter sp. alg1]|uniref:head-tail adaptor protein n=1 Tax=Falsirhodobacter sp. alg1 TaxID=1472418 RepID=UPI0005EDF60C|nr:head-tail adaptor protein [Falsirhodobacter sp. alg1]
MRLTRRLVLERSVSAPDGAGGVRRDWSSLGVLWADVRPGSPREVSGVEAVTPVISLKVTVRAAAPGAPSRPVAGQRFRDGDRILRIIAVVDAGERYLTCHCQEDI